MICHTSIICWLKYGKHVVLCTSYGQISNSGTRNKLLTITRSKWGELPNRSLNLVRLVIYVLNRRVLQPWNIADLGYWNSFSKASLTCIWILLVCGWLTLDARALFIHHSINYDWKLYVSVNWDLTHVIARFPNLGGCFTIGFCKCNSCHQCFQTVNHAVVSSQSRIVIWYHEFPFWEKGYATDLWCASYFELYFFFAE